MLIELPSVGERRRPCFLSSRSEAVSVHVPTFALLVALNIFLKGGRRETVLHAAVCVPVRNPTATCYVSRYGS